MANKNRNRQQSVPEQQPQKTQKGQLVTYFIIFVFGFLSGIAFTVFKGEGPSAVPSATTAEQGQNTDDTSEAILNLEAEVTSNPDNFQSWVRLGHLYYDSNQPEKAIKAYTKSLELHAGDANLLTDLGVMYRRTKQPEKAIDLFNQAIAKDPTHLPSRFNKGIVQMYDLGDTKAAIASWEGVLSINPDAKTSSGESIADFLQHIKEELNKNN
jgi:cytochrome c-type biogenesis protein CcmH/NrfG